MDERDLEILREAAVRRDWSVLQDTLTRLLMSIEFFAGLEIAVTRAYNHLPVFEAAHPESSWARSLLVWITSYGAAPANLPVEATNPHSSPGAANFIAGLIDLTRGVERMTPLENRIRFISSAITNVILAELAAAWYDNNPQAWNAQQTHGDELVEASGATVRQTIQAQFWMDEATAQRDIAAWLEVAEALEMKVRRENKYG